MPWMRLSVCAPPGCTDEIAARLTKAGALAVTLSPSDDTTGDVLEPAPGRTPMWDAVRLEGLFDIDADLSPLAGLDFHIDFLADRDWSETWREGLGPRRFGRLLVLPRAAKDQSNATDVVLRLDPGLAFGTGTHATTALCLERLVQHSLDGRQVLDLGSGSGILAVAAACLGAEVVAVDHDPQARRATLDNSRDNAVEVAIANDLDEVDRQFDLVVANLVAGTIRDLAQALVERLAPDGELVLSGILAGQADWVMDAFTGLEFRFEVPTFRDGWVMLRGLRCPNPNRR